jgi:hypothetical protein
MRGSGRNGGCPRPRRRRGKFEIRNQKFEVFGARDARFGLKSEFVGLAGTIGSSLLSNFRAPGAG